MRTGLGLMLLMSFGCAGSPVTSTNNPTDLSRQDSCRSSSQETESNAPSGRPCLSQHAWWKNVGDALNGVATAARFPRP